MPLSSLSRHACLFSLYMHLVILTLFRFLIQGGDFVKFDGTGCYRYACLPATRTYHAFSLSSRNPDIRMRPCMKVCLRVYISMTECSVLIPTITAYFQHFWGAAICRRGPHTKALSWRALDGQCRYRQDMFLMLCRKAGTIARHLRFLQLVSWWPENVARVFLQ